MTLILSPAQLDTPWRHLLTAALLAVALPAGAGGLIYGAARATAATPGEAVVLSPVGLALLLSPLLSGSAMLLILPVASLLIRLGWFGWLPAAALGLAIGAVVGQITGLAPAAAFGLALTLILRAALGLLRPMRAA